MTQTPTALSLLGTIKERLDSMPITLNGKVLIGIFETARDNSSPEVMPFWGLEFSGCDQIRVTAYYDTADEVVHIKAESRRSGDMEHRRLPHGGDYSSPTWPSLQKRVVSLDKVQMEVARHLGLV